MSDTRAARTEGDEAQVCRGCGSEVDRAREGLCPECFYGSDDRPKPVRDRYRTLADLEDAGVAPYAYSFPRSATLEEARVGFLAAEEEAGGPEDDVEVEGPRQRVAGRVRSFRDLGGSAFAHLEDRSGRLQVYFKQDVLDDRDRVVVDHLDLGDWVGVEGPTFRTRTGEVTVRVEDVELLSKTLRPLPYGKEEVTDEGERVVHSGFTDLESRYRRRYADLAVNPDVREVFRLRARLVSLFRSFLDERGFLEVETPVLQPMYGGAAARPFTTHHHALDTTLYLRIADELYLKRLLVGNLERVYEIGKDFRNEGIDRTHNPEFTMLELYQAFADYEAMMELAEEMVTGVVEEATGELTLDGAFEGVDLTPPWERVSYSETFGEHVGLDPVSATTEALRERARAEGREDADELSRTKLLDALFSAVVEPRLQDPTIVFDYPLETSPLAKPKRGAPELAERFEVVVAGYELVNAFSEINDPLDQWERFGRQARMRAAGEQEAEGFDEDYLRALEYGLPPTGGLGLGVDRLTMLASGRDAIREVILFPLLRPDEGA